MRWLWVLLVCLCLPAHAVQRTSFDHLTTGFELQGAHRDMSCEYCHVQGVFKGTPRTCAGCHTIGTRVSATPKPPTHIASSGRCVLCHAIYNFKPIYRMDHTAALGSCVSCHNNIAAPGKPANHIASDNNCTACHTTVTFTAVRMEHADLLQKEQCGACHNGVRASSKSLRHVPTVEQCGSCHTTLAWNPARFNHTGLMANCGSCHNSLSATGKVAGHPATTHDCSECHRFPNWTPLSFVHTSLAYPGDHRAAPACVACHTSSLDQATWSFPAYRASCAGCHASAFRPESHPKTAEGLPYSVADLQNCTAACHVYTDTNLTTISKARPPGHHKVTDGAFH